MATEHRVGAADTSPTPPRYSTSPSGTSRRALFPATSQGPVTAPADARPALARARALLDTRTGDSVRMAHQWLATVPNHHVAEVRRVLQDLPRAPRDTATAAAQWEANIDRACALLAGEIAALDALRPGAGAPGAAREGGRRTPPPGPRSGCVVPRPAST